jgi:spore maturation protein CgeB
MYEVAMHGALLLSDKAGCDAHEDIFRAGVEAVYYGSVEEAIDKCLYYFRNPAKAIAIAQRGFVRARKDYSPEKVVGDLLDWAATVRPRVAAPRSLYPA